MQVKRREIKNIKVRRILLYYSELERFKISHSGSLQLIQYIFSISERWIEEILRNNNIDDYKDIKLEHQDIDLVIIDAYVKKLNKAALKQRKIKAC